MNGVRAKHGAIGLLMMLATGCATVAEQHYMRLLNQVEELKTKVLPCYISAKESSPALKLRNVLVFDKFEPNKLAKMASTEYLSDEDKNNILEYWSLLQACRKIFIEESGKIHPDYSRILINAFAETDSTLARALKNEITIGDLNTKLEQIQNYMESEWQATSVKITNALNLAHQAEIQMRRQAFIELANAMERWGYQQQMLYNLNKMKTINCYVIGNAITCNEM